MEMSTFLHCSDFVTYACAPHTCLLLKPVVFQTQTTPSIGSSSQTGHSCCRKPLSARDRRRLEAARRTLMPRKKAPLCRCFGCDGGGGPRSKSHAGACTVAARHSLESAGFCRNCARARASCSRCTVGVVDHAAHASLCQGCVARAALGIV